MRIRFWFLLFFTFFILKTTFASLDTSVYVLVEYNKRGKVHRIIKPNTWLKLNDSTDLKTKGRLLILDSSRFILVNKNGSVLTDTFCSDKGIFIMKDRADKIGSIVLLVGSSIPISMGIAIIIYMDGSMNTLGWMFTSMLLQPAPALILYGVREVTLKLGGAKKFGKRLSVKSVPLSILHNHRKVRHHLKNGNA